MPTRIRAAPSGMRKAPVQARSRATIEAILDATAHILGARGWAGTTTNSVAERAGVSIGSLYQYFPNKLALVTAVRKRHFDEVLAALKVAADGRVGRKARIEAYVDGMIAVHSRYPAAHRVLLEESPQDADSTAMHRRFESAYRKGCEELFAANAQRRSADDVAIPAMVLAAAAAGVVHEAARQNLLNSKAFKVELVMLVDSFLSTGA